MGYVQRGVAVDTWWLSSCCFELRQGVDQREGLAGTGSGFLAWQNEGACHCEECKNEAYCTLYSQAVTHPGTDRALRCLTSQIGRDGVCSTCVAVDTWWLSSCWFELRQGVDQRAG